MKMVDFSVKSIITTSYLYEDDTKDYISVDNIDGVEAQLL